MRGGSVCSGIGAPELSAPWIDWRWCSEIEKFPSAVLAHHRPDVPNLGDMTQFGDWPDDPIDLLVGGTPCQSFSVAGLRKGLADPRGNLALTYLAIAARYRPRWLVWENVPGTLTATSHDAPDPRPPEIDLDGSDGPCDGAEVVVEDEYESDENHALQCFLAGLSELGYGWSYRVLDAQYVRARGLSHAVPQRRRRVFVVGYLGDWRRAAAVLFDRDSLSGNPPPRREAGQRVAGTVAQGVALRGRDGGGTVELTGPVASTLRASQGTDEKPYVVTLTGDVSHCLNAGGMGRQDYESETLVAFSCKDHGADASTEVSPTLRAMGHAGSHPNGGGQAAVATDWAVRKLTPLECERLQGFPDGYTRIPVKNRDTAPKVETLEKYPDLYERNADGTWTQFAADGPRYKALGNSWAVNCGRWIFDRIRMVEGMT